MFNVKHSESSKMDADYPLIKAPVARLHPGRYQTRSRFPDDGMAESVRAQGVIQPLVIRTDGDGYEIIAGERRWRAATQAGLLEVPAILRDDLSEVQVAAFCLVENLQRESLNPIDEARGYQRMMDEFSMTQAEVADSVSKSRSHVANMLRLLTLDEYVTDMVLDGEIEAGHARALVGLNAQAQADYANRARREGWSVREIERRVASYKELFTRKPKSEESGAAKRRDADVERLERRIGEARGLPTTIDFDPEKGGVLHIQFFNLDDAQELFDLLLSGGGDE